MHFKKLEMVGFKSFLNKTVCKFEPGITAIVGPNGCGKSNIVDAIKWVFGEQSAKSMRSGSMQDVIFNGTEKFEPVNMAEVSIILSNDDRALPVDYDEVVITRRLFRSGESEYLVNKTPVRLMDVRALLMGTGLGTSSYSVIEQGRMDLILSSKPEERRYVFEEASGITRYKTKKREALLKLERTQENLTRLSDIIREVERQIRSIERQARKADRYKAIFEELKDLEIKVSYRKYRDLNDNNSSIDSQSDDIKKEAHDIKREIGELSGSLERQRNEFNLLMDALQSSQSEIMQLASDIDKNEHVVSVNNERVQELEKFVQRLDWEIEEAIERKESMQRRVEALEQRCKDVSERRGKKEDELSGKEGTAGELTENLDKHQHDLVLGKEKTIDIVSEQTRFRNRLIKINADVQNIEAREKRLRLEKKRVDQERENVSEKLRETERRTEALSVELENQKAEFDRFNAEFLDKQRRLGEAKDQKLAKERRLNEIRPQAEFLKRLISEREGINDSVKEVMKLAESGHASFKGIRGILSEIVSVRKGFEESMESVLGDFSQAIVVNSRCDADAVLDYLSGKGSGSVSFMILDELAGFTGLSGQREDLGDILSDIDDILIADDPYGSALKKMLEHASVSGDPGKARGFIVSEKDPYRTIICKNGELFQKGRYRSRNFSSEEPVFLFGRQEKLEGLVEEEKGITSELSTVGVLVSELEEWVGGSISLKENLETKLREKQIEVADITSKGSILREKLQSLQEEINVINAEIEGEKASMKDLKEEESELNRRLSLLDEENVKIEHAVRLAQKLIDERSREREKLFHEISDVKIALSALKKEEEHLIENLERERSGYLRIDEDVREKRERIAESGSRIKELAEEAGELKTQNERLLSVKESKMLENAEKKGQKDRLAGLISVSEKDLREKEERLEAVRDRARDIDIRTKEIEYKKEALLQKIRDNYKVDLAGIKMEIENTFDWAGVDEKIIELKNRLEKMGEVSLGAVEEHKQLEERFSFLSRQRDDLMKSRDDIMAAIRKINATTRKMFMETFEAIRREFNTYFKMLFNGGKAELVLEDENDVLECGIDIVVRPPGKKLQNIMLLSGGEKAMTAIALIFAIFKVNPSPFCILDEIDAPLDESNVVRFTRVLQEFLKLSQFIIVTHNRMTIQLADVLYGITMEEKGVSKVVSVKFSEEENLLEEENIPVAA